MVKYKLIITTFLIIFFTGKNLAQTDFRKGYYIELKGDTVFGLLDYRGDIRNSKFCIFKKNSLSDKKKFYPGEIQSYRFTEGKFYVSKKLLVDSIERFVFAEFLINGIADLFYIRDLGGNHYYIEDKKGRIFELKNEEETVYIEGQGEGVRETNEYIGLLKVSFMDCMEVQSEVDKAELNHKSLINLTKKYHDYVCDGEKCIIYEKKPPIFDFKIMPIIGVNLSQIQFNTNSIYYNFAFKPKFSYNIGAKCSIGMPRINERLFFNVSNVYSNYYFFALNKNMDISGSQYSDFHIYTHSITTYLGIDYKFPKQNVQPVFGFGVVLNNNFKRESKIIVETVQNFIVESNEYLPKTIEQIVPGGYLNIGAEFILSEKINLYSGLNVSYLAGSGYNIMNGSLNIAVSFN